MSDCLKYVINMVIFSLFCQYGQKLLTDAMSRVSVNTDAVQACKSTDLVIEAMEDDVVAKQTMFASLDAAAPRYPFLPLIGIHFCRS